MSRSSLAAAAIMAATAVATIIVLAGIHAPSYVVAGAIVLATGFLVGVILSPPPDEGKDE